MTSSNNILGKQVAGDLSTERCFDPEAIDITSIHILLSRTGHMAMQSIEIVHVSGS